MSTQEFFLEVGLEELPADNIASAFQQLSEKLQARLSEALIDFGAVHTFGTPRRFGVVFEEVAERGHDQTEELVGPPTRVAFDTDGNPRVPAIKFAEKVGLPLEEIQRKETPKGEYLVAEKLNKGAETVALLNEAIPEVLGQIHFPKVMRWGTNTQAFARPIHWLCARLGDTPLSFSFASVESATNSRGHRFLAPDTFEVASYKQFQDECRERFIILDPEERKQIIRDKNKELADSVKGQTWNDEGLIELNAYLTEYPVPLLAHFEEEYLKLPKELLRTSMRHHLKCFALMDKNGDLLPHFIAVANMPSKTMEKIQHGFQRVLRARLADAEFFYKEDQKKDLETLATKLDDVIYQSKLGSYGDKVRRVKNLAKPVAEALELNDSADNAVRAATLYKADLVSEMVFEFPELQGIMGRYYAQNQGEADDVASAIQEHYLPAGQDDPLPETDTGKILAIAERLDTLVGGFGAGLKPTGSKDQYGLRRQAIGLLRILKEYKLPGRLDVLLEAAAETLTDKLDDAQTVQEDVLGYLQARLVQILLADEWPRDQVDAVCVRDLVARYPVHQLRQLLDSLQEALQSGVLAGLAYSFKRVNNILRAAAKKKEVDHYNGLGSALFNEKAPSIDEGLLEEGRERELFDAYLSVQERVEKALADANFATGLEVLLELREPIDNMFDDVMVMAQDDALRANRLLLMRGIARLAFLDFSRIDTEDAESA